MENKTLKIEGMHCHHCVMALRKSFQIMDGIQEAEVEVGTAKLSFDESKVSDDDINDAITKVGFKVRDY